MEYAQQFCKISPPNGEQSIYRIRKGQNLVRIGRPGGDEPKDIDLGPNDCRCISRVHCLLVKRDGKWWLVRKGKYFPLLQRKSETEEEEIHTEAQLADGDFIRILGEYSTKGEIFWIIYFCDGETTLPVLMTAFLKYDKEHQTLYRGVKGGEQRISLSGQVLDLADFMLERPGHIFSHEELLRAIWGDDPSKGLGNLRNLIHRLREEIEPPGTKEHFLIAHPGSDLATLFTHALSDLYEMAL